MADSRYARLRAALAELKPGEQIFFDDRITLGHYNEAINRLVSEGIATTEFVDMPEEQYAKLIVRPTAQKAQP